MLTLAVKEGDSIFIGDRPLRVEKVFSFCDVTVSFCGRDYRVTDEQMVPLMADVRVQMCPPEGNPRSKCLLVFDCPKEVRILREALYAKA